MLPKLKKWVIKKIVGDTPVIMNVTLVLDKPIMGASPEGVFEKSNIRYTENALEEMNRG